MFGVSFLIIAAVHAVVGTSTSIEYISVHAQISDDDFRNTTADQRQHNVRGVSERFENVHIGIVFLGSGQS